LSQVCLLRFMGDWHLDHCSLTNTMRWIRVNISDVTKLVLPSVCANCMQHPADTPTPIVRSIGGPFVGSVTTHAQWPFCKRCSGWCTRSARRCKQYAIVPALLIAVFALFLAWYKPNVSGFNPMALWLLLIAFLVAVVGCTAITLVQWLSARPNSCITNFLAVRPIRGGKALFSGKWFAAYEFLHPLYVEALINANDPDNVSCNPKQLEKAKAAFLKWESR
jgi:hypothetical protein